ncbi:MAG: Hpt domain-containing protein [Abditibacteriota bacterium]|nr:Hpt domain-containing protein [Abditibacteriota bacterium]
MNIKDFYRETGGNYEEAVARLMDEARVVKFVKKFAQSSELAEFEERIAAKDYKEAFRHIHSLKGMCANLSMTRLRDSSSELCETLRNGEPSQDITPLINRVKADYKQVIDAIGALDQ